MQQGPRIAARDAAVDPIERALRRLARTGRAVIVSRRTALLLAGSLAALVALALVDYALRLPAWIRWFHLLGGLTALVVVLWRWLGPALRFRPDPATIALRLEKRDERLRGWLAAAIDLAKPTYLAQAQPMERALAQRALREARSRWKSAPLGGVVDAAPAVRGLATLALALIPALTAALAAPGLSRIGAARTLAPWLDVAWPKRTQVADVTAATVHPRGVALPIRAALLRSPASPERTDVAVRYRLIRDGRAAPTQRALLTWQRRDAQVEGDALRKAGLASASSARGALFERLIETSADAVEYSIETSDDATPWRTVRLIEPPAVQSARARIVPPEYAADMLAAGQRVGFDLDMGAGRDERAVAPTALAGSSVELTLTLNKPVPAFPTDDQWLARTLGEDAAEASVALAVRDEHRSVWTLRWRLVEPTRLRIALEDEHGISSVEESVFRFSVVQDSAARVAILEPAADRAVLSTAVVDVQAEARDDVGLDALWIERQIAKPDAGPGREPSGPGGALKPAGHAVELVRAPLDAADSANADAVLDIASLGVAPGDEIWLTAFAQDILGARSGERPPSQSARRTLRIISQTQFIEEIQRELSAIRQDAIRIDERQGELIERLERIPPRIDEARRGQARLSQRIARQGEAIDAIRDRLAENALDDASLSRLLNQAQELLGGAARRSQEAQNALDELAQQAAAEEELDDDEQAQADEQLEAARDEQQEVRDALAQLAELLDRGEDAWVARRKIEDLARQQRELREQAQELARETAGRTEDELTPEQRSDLQRIADAQRRLAEQAREATRELRQRERELRDSDPAAAAGLARAAQRASERQISETMEQAAEQAQRNQLGQAARAQQQAAQDLEQMLEDLEQGQREREETLRRLLTSLIDAIDSLIRQQENELTRAQAAIDAERAPAGLDLGMIALNTNTLGVLDQASAAGPELAPVADLLGQAVEAQTRAIIALRPARAGANQLEAAREHEAQSLDLLEQARAEAERLERELAQQMAQRQRDELRRAYRDMLVQQRAIREETTPLANVADLSRRQRRDAQLLGQRQGELIAALAEMRDAIDGLQEAQVFLFTNELLETAFDASQSALAQAAPADAIPHQESAIRLLQSVLRALAESRQREDELRQAPGGGGGGGQQQSQRQVVPPLTELRLLRELQQDLALRTRAAADAPDAADQAVQLGQEQERLRELGESVIERIEQERQQQPPIGGPPPGGGA